MDYFDREKSIGVKGIAILMMFWNHLFMHPDMLKGGNYWSSVYTLRSGMPIEAFLSPVFHICVPLYIFLAGYAFSVKYVLRNGNRKTMKQQMHGLYRKYWIVFLIFIPVLAVLGIIQIAPLELCGNLIGFLSTYVGEWWFFALYVELVLLAFLFRDKLKNASVLKISVWSFVVCMFGYTCYYIIQKITPELNSNLVVRGGVLSLYKTAHVHNGTVVFQGKII